MTQPIHPVLAKVVQATSGWVLQEDGPGFRVRFGCVVHCKLHMTMASAMAELEQARARAAVQALMEPVTQDMHAAGREVCYEAWATQQAASCREVFSDMLRPLVEGEGE